MNEQIAGHRFVSKLWPIREREGGRGREWEGEGESGREREGVGRSGREWEGGRDSCSTALDFI